MPERELAYELKYSLEERKLIEGYARKLATLGESGIGDFVFTRNSVTIMGAQTATEIPAKDGLDVIRNVRRQMEKMDEIIKQARVLLELKGEDTASKLRKLSDTITWGKLGEE